MLEAGFIFAFFGEKKQTHQLDLRKNSIPNYLKITNYTQKKTCRQRKSIADVVGFEKLSARNKSS